MALYVADITQWIETKDGNEQNIYDLITEGRGTPSSNLLESH